MTTEIIPTTTEIIPTAHVDALVKLPGFEEARTASGTVAVRHAGRSVLVRISGDWKFTTSPHEEHGLALDETRASLAEVAASLLPMTCGTCGHRFADDTPAGRCPREADHEDDAPTPLTRTQRAALAELQGGAHLYPATRGRYKDPRAGREYSRATLQALVNAGHARWSSPVPRHLVALGGLPEYVAPAVAAGSEDDACEHDWTLSEGGYERYWDATLADDGTIHATEHGFSDDGSSMWLTCESCGAHRDVVAGTKVEYL